MRLSLLWLAAAAACAGSKTTSTNYQSGGAGGVGGTNGMGSGAASSGAAAGTASSGSAGQSDGTATAGAGGDGELGASGPLLYIKASNSDETDSFGDALALSDHWLAVGARHESSNATGVNGDQADDSEDDSGAVYVFSDEGAGWAQRAYLKASNAEAGDGFGAVLAISASTLAVGAPGEDGTAMGVNGDQDADSGGNQGAVYVFVHAEGEWQQQAYIKASNTEPVDSFGTGLALDGDTLVVGAPREDSAATGAGGNELDDTAPDSGAVYTFARSADSWTPGLYLKASNTAPDDGFGTALALSADTLAVSAPGVSDDSGAVYLFDRSGAAFEESTIVHATDSFPGARFGDAIALDGNFLAVGSPGVSLENGAAHVFERSGADWVEVAYLVSESSEDEIWFGNALALAGDTLIVGALGEDNLTGVAYLYERGASGWEQVERRTAPNAEPGDRFGISTAISAERIAIAASNEGSDASGINGDQHNNNGPGSGAVFLYAR